MEDLIYLDEVVNSYLSQYRLPDSAYGRVIQLGIRGRKELHLHSAGKPVKVELEVQADKTLELPCDLLNIISIGIDHGEDNIDFLTESEDLTIPNSFLVDETNSRITLGYNFSHGNLVLEYLPQASQDGEYLVHPLFVEPLINYIIWQDGRGDRKTSDGTKRENERIYYNSLRHARRAVKPFNLDQVYKSYSRVLSNALSVYKWI